MKAALIVITLLQTPPKTLFQRKKSVVTAQKLQGIKTFMTLELSKHYNSVSTLSSS